MNYKDLMLLRDETIKNSVKRRFAGKIPPDTWQEFERDLERGFSEGARFWFADQAPALFEEHSQRVLEKEIDELMT